RLEHPLATIVFDSACAIINDELLTESEVVDRLNQIAVFPNQHAALSIVYFSHDGDGSIVEELYDEILQGWD
ncbi:MAG: hypothetical protein HRU27_03340, partial [Rhizobiaceae bacterium]|nr:hypothetical protein [Rhizobiaceae bacterium]